MEAIVVVVLVDFRVTVTGEVWSRIRLLEVKISRITFNLIAPYSDFRCQKSFLYQGYGAYLHSEAKCKEVATSA